MGMDIRDHLKEISEMTRNNQVEFDGTLDQNEAQVSKPHLFEGKAFINNTRGMRKWREAEKSCDGRSAYDYILPSDEMPDLGATANEVDPLLRVKLFDPTGSWTWYLAEFDGTDEAFGWVDGFEFEGGSISLQELATARGKLGLPIERDLFWTPRKLSEVRK